MDSETKDKILLSSLSLGNEKAFDALFVDYYPKVLQFVMRFCRDRAEAENIAQDLFMNLWMRRDQLAGIGSLDDYLFVSARNAALRYIQLSFRSGDSKVLATLHDPATDAHTRLCHEELYGFIVHEIEAMPEQRRRIFLMSREEGLSNSEIADRLGISKRTVEKHISLALAQLRKLLYLMWVLTFISQN